MRWILLALVLLGAPATTHTPLAVYVDGQLVGTLDGEGMVYNAGGRELLIFTREGVFGCQQDRIFWDRYE